MKKGMVVTVILHGAGVDTEEKRKVSRVSRDGKIWLEDRSGWEENEPYIDRKRDGVFGFWSEIKESEK